MDSPLLAFLLFLAGAMPILLAGAWFFFRQTGGMLRIIGVTVLAAIVGAFTASLLDGHLDTDLFLTYLILSMFALAVFGGFIALSRLLRGPKTK